MKVFVRYRPGWSTQSSRLPWVAYYYDRETLTAPPFFRWGIFVSWDEAMAWARRVSLT